MQKITTRVTKPASQILGKKRPTAVGDWRSLFKVARPLGLTLVSHIRLRDSPTSRRPLGAVVLFDPIDE